MLSHPPIHPFSRAQARSAQRCAALLALRRTKAKLKLYAPSHASVDIPCYLLHVQIGELAGLAVGATVLLNVLFAGPISGGSMNPARTIGPAIIAGRYAGLWVYIAGPVCGAVAGAWAYNLIRFTDKPLREITRSTSFLRSARGS